MERGAHLGSSLPFFFGGGAAVWRVTAIPGRFLL